MKPVPLNSPGAEAFKSLDVLLASLCLGHKMPAADGLEARVLARLQASFAAEQTSAPARRSRSVGWVHAAIAASLLCVFSGGMLVERELTTRIGPHQIIDTPLSAEVRAPSSNLAPTSAAVIHDADTLRTASARREPAVAVPVGRRRGRGSEVAGVRPDASAWTNRISKR